MGVGADRCFFDLVQQRAECRIAGKVCTQHECVDEEPNQVLDLYAIASGDWRADDDVFLIRVAPQQSLKGGEQRHEQSSAFVLAQFGQTTGEIIRKSVDFVGAARWLSRSTRT